MGKVILWPERREAQYRSDGNVDGYDLTGASVLDVADDFIWAGRGVDWASASIVDDMDPIKAAMRHAVCDHAENLRGQFITPGSGQAITYARKEQEARAWSVGGDPATAPFLAAEAEATGLTIDALAALVIAQADAWAMAASAIEARRRGLLVAIDGAETLGAVEAIDIEAGWISVSDET